MKKKKQHDPKPKEFVAAPFAALKGVTATAAAPPPVKSQEPVAGKAAVMDDNDAFFLAMAGVQRLGGKKQPAATAKPISPLKTVIRRIDEQEQQQFLEAVAGMKLDVTFGDEEKDEPGPAVPRACSRLKQLRRGTIRVDYELDLHGLTRDEAVDALKVFLQGACRRGQQAVLVITGRGNHSGDEPVLKKAVDKWLRQEGQEMVAEFLPAPREMGGDGAVVVFLRQPPKN
jgi:DNA-nicking Smr family endonuclease